MGNRLLDRDVPGLGSLELLAAIARHGSMSAAAAELDMSQQAVSLRIRSIERDLGFALLVRSHRGCELTPAGGLLNEWATGLLAQATELAASIATLRADRHANLRIASSLTVAEYHLPGWLVAFHEQQARAGLPRTEVELAAVNTGTVVARIRAGQADLGFVEGPYQPSGLHARVVARDELVIVVRPDHPWTRRRSPITAALLARTPMIAREPNSGSRQAFDDALAAALPPDTPIAEPALEVTTPAAVRAAVAAGIGPTAISSRAVADDVTLGRVRVITTNGLNLHRKMHAIWTGDPRPPAGPTRDLLALTRST